VALAAGAAFLITSTVEIMKAPPPEPAPVTGATVRDVTANARPKPDAALVDTTLSLRISQPVMVMAMALVPLEIVPTPAKGPLVVRGGPD
jgi:hypothetical protein